MGGLHCPPVLLRIIAWLTGCAPGALIALPEVALGDEPLRFVSGHFAHADFNLWTTNSEGLLACGLLFKRNCRGHFVGLVITGVLFANVWLPGWSSRSTNLSLIHI